MKRRTLLLGLGSVAAGATLIGGSEAFSDASADRGVGVSVASDPEALLGIEGTSNTSVTPSFTNNTNVTMDVTLDSSESIELDVDDNGTWETSPVTFSLSSGQTREVNVRFAGECNDAGPATLDIDATLLDGSTDVGSITLSRDVEIPESGQVAVTPNVKSAGNSGFYEFELENTGCVDVTIVGLGINETTEPTADKVGGRDNDDIFTAEGQSVASTVIPIDNSNPDSATIVSLDQNVSLDQDITKTFEFDRFRTASNGNAPMKDEDVKITLEFSDGSTLVEKLCPNACSL